MAGADSSPANPAGLAINALWDTVAGTVHLFYLDRPAVLLAAALLVVAFLAWQYWELRGGGEDWSLIDGDPE